MSPQATPTFPLLNAATGLTQVVTVATTDQRAEHHMTQQLRPHSIFFSPEQNVWRRDTGKEQSVVSLWKHSSMTPDQPITLCRPHDSDVVCCGVSMATILRYLVQVRRS
ncbi:hypothetical protein INR49_019008 [Caranx melampygus]|nr:hypothetical protein INR49_019008 [Caranx melampygus]